MHSKSKFSDGLHRIDIHPVYRNKNHKLREKRKRQGRCPRCAAQVRNKNNRNFTICCKKCRKRARLYAAKRKQEIRKNREIQVKIEETIN